MLDEEAQLSPIVRTGPPERPPQTAGHSVDSMAGRIGLSVLHRSAPRRVAGTPQLQAPLEDLTDPSATGYEGDGNSKKEAAVANVQRTGRLERGISSAVVNEEAQLSQVLGQKTVFQRVCTELNFFDLELQLCSCRSQTRNATNWMAISYLIATHFLQRWPGSRVAILLSL